MSKTNPPNKNRKRQLAIISKYVLLTVFIIIFLGVGATAGLVASALKDEPIRTTEEIRNEVFKNNLTSSVYASNGDLIDQLKTDEQRTFVQFDQISEHVKNATIAIEDRDFKNHSGVSMKGTARAIFQQITNSDVQTGGSTITQQLARNSFYGLEKTYTRKLKEIFLALRMERVMSKDEILTAYLNKINYGKAANNKNVYGIQAAAKGYFNKDAKDLNIAEAAYLAGIPQRPTAYSAFKQGEFKEENFQLAKNRQQLVLKAMLDGGFINQQQYDEAVIYAKEHMKGEEDFNAEEIKQSSNQYAYLMDDIKIRAAKALLQQQGVSEDSPDYDAALETAQQELSTGGYKIYTTIDKKIHDAMNVVADNNKYFPSPKTYNFVYKDNTGKQVTKKVDKALLQVGATLIHNKTGAILGFVGGRDYENYQVNHSTAKRQPGSSIKPVVSYAPALELGKVQPASAIDDIPLGQKWEPNNYDGKYHGRLTARVALNKSYNIPAVKVYQSVGTDQGYEFYKKLGYDIKEKTFKQAGSTAAIGSLEASPEEMASAYSSFANSGTHMDAYMIEKILDKDGKTFYTHEAKPEAVFSPQTAFLITDMLKTVMTNGTGGTARKYISGREVAGKTGTTNDDRELWFVGYTPEITLSVATYYDLPTRVTPHSVPQDTWGRLMQAIFKADPTLSPSNARFSNPGGLVRMTVSTASGNLPSELTKKGNYLVTDWFNKKYVPTKLEDGLGEARLIMFNKTNYVAKPETPDEFVDTGVFLIREPYKLPAGKAKPLDYENEMPTNNDPRASSGTPAAPATVSMKGNVVSWSKNTNQNIVGYRVYRASAEGVGFSKIGVVRQPDNNGGIYAYTDAGGSGQFAYYVTSVDVGGLESAPSEIVGKTPEPTVPTEPTNPGDGATGIPSKPTGLNATPQGGKVNFSWNANPTEDNVTKYYVYFKESDLGEYQLIYQGSKTSISMNYPKSKIVNYRVIAENANGKSKAADLRVIIE